MKNRFSAVDAHYNASPTSPNFSRRFSMAQCLGLSLGLTAAVFSGQNAQAQSTWTGATSQDYNDGSNWDSGFPNGVNALINTATGNFPIISATPTSGTPVDIFVGRSGTGRLDQRAGDAGTGNGNWFFLGSDGGSGAGTGTFNLANTGATGGTTTGFGQGTGNFTAGRVHVGGGQFNGNGTGTLNMNTSGTLTATGGNNGGVNVGVTVGFAAGDVGTFNLDNGTVNSVGETWFGGAGTGTINQSGGTINSTGYVPVGRTGGTGVINLSGGTLNAATAFGFITVGSAAGSTGTVNVSGTGTLNSTAGGMILGEGWQGAGTATGTLNVSGNGTVNLGTNTLTMGTVNTNDGTVGNGTLNLNGGNLQAGAIASGGGIATVNFNGGTLTATQASTTFLAGLTSANVRNGGAIFNTNGFDVTVDQALLHSTAAGDNAVDGGLIKNGAGMLTVTAASTYTGATQVNAGTLTVSPNGSINASSSVRVAAGTLTLQNTAVISDTATLTLLAGTTLQLNAGIATSETIGRLVLNGVTEPIGTYTAAQLNALNSGVTFSSANGETLRVTAVPEPSTWAFGLMGAALLTGWSQRRRAQAWLQMKRTGLAAV